MQKKGLKKGISLIVLVITIIVMIILAAAIILSLNNAGIIGNANKAVNDSNMANVKSAADLAYAEYLIDKPEGVTDLGKYLTQKLIDNNTITGDDYIIGICDNETVVAKAGTAAYEYYKGNIKIGDYINYDYTPVLEGAITAYTSAKLKNGYADQIFKLNESYNSELYGWQVMGIDKEGRLLLLSEDLIQPVDGTGLTFNDKKFLVFSGATDETLEINLKREVYFNATEELSNICSMYGYGYGATGARCITIEDVDEIVDYNKDKAGRGEVYYANDIRAYGNTVTYYWEKVEGEITVYYEGTNGKSGYFTDTHTSFEWFEGNEYHHEKAPENLNEGTRQKITTITNNYYRYYPETLVGETEYEAGEKIGKIKEGTIEYDLLFKDKSGTIDNCYYWLSSQYTALNKGYFSCGYRRVKTGYVTGGVLVGSQGTGYANYAGIRAVVSLKPDIVLEKTIESVTLGDNILNVYNIK